MKCLGCVAAPLLSHSATFSGGSNSAGTSRTHRQSAGRRDVLVWSGCSVFWLHSWLSVCWTTASRLNGTLEAELGSAVVMVAGGSGCLALFCFRYTLSAATITVVGFRRCVQHTLQQVQVQPSRYAIESSIAHPLGHRTSLGKDLSVYAICPNLSYRSQPTLRCIAHTND